MVTVQRKTYVFPGVPVKVVLNVVVLVNAVSGSAFGFTTKLHAPVPIAGLFAPSVTVVPQKF